jgi:homocysteine S-methyltransferase
LPSLPNLQLIGGCCGTDHRHIAAICARCFS